MSHHRRWCGCQVRIQHISWKASAAALELLLLSLELNFNLFDTQCMSTSDYWVRCQVLPETQPSLLQPVLAGGAARIQLLLRHAVRACLPTEQPKNQVKRASSTKAHSLPTGVWPKQAVSTLGCSASVLLLLEGLPWPLGMPVLPVAPCALAFSVQNSS